MGNKENGEIRQLTAGNMALFVQERYYNHRTTVNKNIFHLIIKHPYFMYSVLMYCIPLQKV